VSFGYTHSEIPLPVLDVTSAKPSKEKSLLVGVALLLAANSILAQFARFQFVFVD